MNRTEFDITNLKKALESLKKCIVDYKKNDDTTIKEYIKDACVKRFEYTVETSWKLMKKFLKLEYGKTDKELTVNNIFRLMEGFGFIVSWEKWKDYYAKRNDTSHEYNEDKSLTVLKEAGLLIQDCEYLCEKLQNFLEE